MKNNDSIGKIAAIALIMLALIFFGAAAYGAVDIVDEEFVESSVNGKIY